MPAYEAEKARFASFNAQVLGVSVDSVPCLTAWAKSLGGINYPLMSDFWPHGEVAKKYGVLRKEGYSERAIFLIDREGVIRYIDIHDITQQPENDVVIAELRKIEPQLAAAVAAEPKPTPAPLPKGGIVMYCSKWCPDCRRAKAWLDEHGQKYVQVDVYAVPGAADQVRAWCGGKLVTPTFDINDTIVVNFDEKRLQELLG